PRPDPGVRRPWPRDGAHRDHRRLDRLRPLLDDLHSAGDGRVRLLQLPDQLLTSGDLPRPDASTTTATPAISSASAGRVAARGAWPSQTQASRAAPGTSSRISTLTVVAGTRC